MISNYNKAFNYDLTNNLSLFGDICYVLLIIYISINYYFNSFSGSQWFVYFLSSGCIYFLIKEVIKVNLSIRIIIRILLIFGGIMEASLGYLQLYGFTESNNTLYKITGSLQNPGPFSGFLSILLPLAFQIVLSPPRRNKLFERAIVFISWVFIFLTFVLLPATLSRAGWLAATIGVGIVLIKHYQVLSWIKHFISRNHKIALLCSINTIFLFIILFASVYYLKKDSADGRLLIWKITTQIIAEHPLTGIGPNNFAGAYGQAQAAFFSKGNATQQEKFVAGDPEHAFNEFLQITAENGFIGLFLFLLVVFFAFQNTVQSRQIEISGCLAAFLVFSCFSYPFSVWQLNGLFILLLAMAGEKTHCKHQKNRNEKWQRLYIYGSTLVILAILMIWQGKTWQEKQTATLKWKEEQFHYNMEVYEGTVDNYRKLYWHLRDEPKYLFELALCLSKTKLYEESNQILRDGSRLSSDPMFWNIMGKNFQAMCQYQKAEECYMHAYHMIPNRLYPLYLLANLYFSSDQYEKAIIVARQVISKEPKVMSTAIQEIKIEMKEKIISYQNKE